MRKYQTEVLAGAAHLDRVMPNWIDRINTETLDTASAYRCVLGQLYRYYHNGVPEELTNEQEAEWIMSHGFTIRDFYGSADFVEQHATLTNEWLMLISERKCHQLLNCIF